MHEVERLRSQHERLCKEIDCDRLELYHRSSTAMRIGFEESEEPTLIREGAEEGIAVRLPGGFAAASGCDERSLRWAIDRAMACPTAAGANDQVERAGELEDLDEVMRLPPATEMLSWLDSALRRLPDRPTRAWVEAAVTVECLVTDGGLSTLRSRCRGWAMALVGPKPLIVASRRWRELPEGGWNDLLADREHAGGQTGLLFTPESAATLVSALVRTLHADESTVGKSAGPGWKLCDDPRSPAALFGGSFDDAAFTTKRKLLADGERILGTISGPGNLLRPSFRDPPQPLPMHLVVEPGLEKPPGDPLPVSDLTIHPISAGEWALQVGDGLIRSTPADLIRRCSAAVGPQRLSRNGVLTPGLLFEGLRVGR